MQQLCPAAALASLAVLLASPALAADRALLVGVGKYRNPQFNLSGIDLDIAMMKDTARRLGFDEAHTVVLEDEKATHANVVGKIKSHLGGAGPNDRVLFYFSGHGTGVRDLNGDEKDGQDEALVLYDFVPHSKGLLVDDEIAALMKRFKAEKVIMAVDACHSGTVYKSIGDALGKDISSQQKYIEGEVDGGDAKGFGVEGRPDHAGRGGGEAIPRLVAFTAARDDQSAIATPKGSIFTLGLHGAVLSAVSSGKTSIGYTDLGNHIARWVRERSQKFQPSVVWSSDLEKPHKLHLGPRRQMTHRNGPGWQRLSSIAKRAAKLDVSGTRSKYALGEHLQLTFRAPEDGYINIVAVDGSTDETIVLFPNEYETNNFVGAGTSIIPGRNAKFDLPARRPTGRNLVVVFWTQKKVNLHEASVGPRGPKGDLLQGLGNPVTLTKEAITRGWGVREVSSRTGNQLRAGMVEMDIVD